MISIGEEIPCRYRNGIDCWPPRRRGGRGSQDEYSEERERKRGFDTAQPRCDTRKTVEGWRVTKRNPPSLTSCTSAVDRQRWHHDFVSTKPLSKLFRSVSECGLYRWPRQTTLRVCTIVGAL